MPGTFLPKELSDAVDLRLRDCEQLPRDFEQAVEDYQLLLDVEIEQRLQQQKRHIYAEVTERFQNLSSYDDIWEPWEIGLVVAAGVTGGLLVGFLAGYAYQGMAK